MHDLEKNDLLQNRFIIKDNRAIFENYLAGQGINTQHLKENINANLRNQKNKKHAEALKNAQQTKLSSQFPKPPKKDDNEDEKNKHPHGKFEGADYHHPKSRGNKSPGPKDGQKALDNSVRIKITSPRRVGVSAGEIVVLGMTLENLYHGHVVTWAEILTNPNLSEVKDALIESGLVDKLGNILCKM